jgi:hypothetical protein
MTANTKIMSEMLTTTIVVAAAATREITATEVAEWLAEAAAEYAITTITTTATILKQ